MSFQDSLWVLFALGVAASLFPYSGRLFSYLDTVIHEAGHGIASLPTGAPVPSIVIRPNSSGETKSTAGQLNNFLPLPIAFLFEKFSRLLSLLSGYSAPIILASILLSLIFSIQKTFSPWFLLALLLTAIGTLLWTVVKATDNPYLFVAAIVAIIAVSLYNKLGIITIAIVALYLALLIFSKIFISSIAVLVSALGFAAFVITPFGIKLPFLLEAPHLPLTYSSYSIVLALLAFISVFVLLSSRSLFSIAVVLFSSAVLIGLIIQPWWDWRYSAMFLSGALMASGIKSLMNLYKITFSSSAIGTDVTFAAEELGLSSKVWYFILVAFTIVVSFVIID